MSTFEVKKDQFYLDNEPFKIISGAVHYFRIVPEYWRDRLEKLKSFGCNTVETYIPWNVHEPKRGKFCFEGMYDLAGFIHLAAELGLWVIIRPSPYICAEWEFGGLPAWLLAEEEMHVRSCCEPFLRHVRDYYKVLFDVLRPLQVNFGGPVILMQVENEYGYYGNDTRYMEAILQLMLENGTIVPLITSDGPWGDALRCGSIKGILPTGNFGSKAGEQMKVLAEYTGGGPLMCAEFWMGWFDHWGCVTHNTTSAADNAENLDKILEQGNVNIYMFVGGTNFGFMNGSNYYDVLTPDTTSYDYDAVLSENGAFTAKYEVLKNVISKYAPIPEVHFSTATRSAAYGECRMKSMAGLFEVIDDLSEGSTESFPKSMEKMGQGYGYILYRTDLKQEKALEKIRLYGANDRANIFIDGKPVLTLYDLELLREHPLDSVPCENGRMDILVENMGRVNFGPMMDKQRKGIDSAVVLNGHQHYQWTHYPLPLDNLEKLDFSKGFTDGEPAFCLFELEADEPGDTWLDFTGWGKGCAFINGFNLGRYWEIGPQKRLYIPGPLIRKGRNEIILFETEGRRRDFIVLKDTPDLG